MENRVKKEDLRISRTHNALTEALFTLLGSQRFTQLTVNALCKEAKVSRAAFYAHFCDKYALLKFWFTQLISELMDGAEVYAHAEKMFNEFFLNNAKVITNLLSDADCETIEILCESIRSNLQTDDDSSRKGERDPKHIALSSFYVGGTIYYLLWQVKNKFPPDMQVMNPYFYEISQLLLKRGDDQE